MRRKQFMEMPSSEELEKELNRVKYKRRYHVVLRSTVYTLITVAAIAVFGSDPVDAGVADLRWLHDADAQRRKHCRIGQVQRLPKRRYYRFLL